MSFVFAPGVKNKPNLYYVSFFHYFILFLFYFYFIILLFFSICCEAAVSRNFVKVTKMANRGKASLLFGCKLMSNGAK